MVTKACKSTSYCGFRQILSSPVSTKMGGRKVATKPQDRAHTIMVVLHLIIHNHRHSRKKLWRLSCLYIRTAANGDGGRQVTSPCLKHQRHNQFLMEERCLTASST